MAPSGGEAVGLSCVSSPARVSQARGQEQHKTRGTSCRPVMNGRLRRKCLSTHRGNKVCDHPSAKTWAMCVCVRDERRDTTKSAGMRSLICSLVIKVSETAAE